MDAYGRLLSRNLQKKKKSNNIIQKKNDRTQDQASEEGEVITAKFQAWVSYDPTPPGYHITVKLPQPFIFSVFGVLGSFFILVNPRPCEYVRFQKRLRKPRSWASTSTSFGAADGRAQTTGYLCFFSTIP